MSPEVLGVLTSLGTAAVNKLVDTMGNNSCDSKTIDSNPIQVLPPVTGKEPINVTINLNFYIDGEAVKKMKLLERDNKFIDGILKQRSIPMER